MKAQMFKVTGWQQALKGREPMETVEIEAENSMDAANQYAVLMKIPLVCWNNGTKSPRVVIRAEEIS